MLNFRVVSCDYVCRGKPFVDVKFPIGLARISLWKQTSLKLWTSEHRRTNIAAGASSSYMGISERLRGHMYINVNFLENASVPSGFGEKCNRCKICSNIELPSGFRPILLPMRAFRACSFSAWLRKYVFYRAELLVDVKVPSGFGHTHSHRRRLFVDVCFPRGFAHFSVDVSFS